MRKLMIVPKAKKEEMRLMLNEYLTELSEFDPDIKFDNAGTPIYKWFDHYFVEKPRYPIYLIIDNNVAGMAMIRELKDGLYDFAEFYVKPGFRQNGNAMWFAKEVTELFEGKFTFATRFTNTRAIRFWTKFAQCFGAEKFTDDDIWRTWTIR